MKPSICTASGIEFDLADPKPEQVRVTDIAHALAHKPRFGGHTSYAIGEDFAGLGSAHGRTMTFYSVAQHSCWVHDQLYGQERAYGLLHDAAEAYLCDLPAPAKQLCPDFCRVENNILRAVYIEFGLSPGAVSKKPLGVAYFDDLAWRAERRKFMPHADWWPAEKDAPAVAEPWKPRDAYIAFMSRFHNLVHAGYVTDRRLLTERAVNAEGIAHA
jgi:uncharacterized protein